MHGGVHPREVGAPHGPRLARDGVRKKQLLDHDIIILECLTLLLVVSLVLQLKPGVQNCNIVTINQLYHESMNPNWFYKKCLFAILYNSRPAGCNKDLKEIQGGQRKTRGISGGFRGPLANLFNILNN